MNLNKIEYMIYEELSQDIEYYGSIYFEEDNKIGLELDLFDYLNKETKFEQAIEELLWTLDKILPKEINFSHCYSEPTSVSGLDGLECLDYHCYLKVWKEIK